MNLLSRVIFSIAGSLLTLSEFVLIYESIISLGPEPVFEEYFADANYAGIGFPVVQGASLLVTARHKEKGYFTVLRVTGDKAEELVTADGQITYAVFANPRELILVMAEPQVPRRWAQISGKYHLYRYQLDEKKWTRISDGKERVVWDSKPILSPTGTIFFSADGWIKEMFPDGRVKNWVQGDYPFWLEEGKSFFYAGQERTLNLMDVETGQNKVIACHIALRSQPSLSPDKQYILFREAISVKSDAVGLRILSVDGRVRKELRKIERNWIGSGPSRNQLEWLPDSMNVK